MEFDNWRFYATVDLNAIDLHDQLASWQQAYNWDRPHSSLNGKTPIDRVCELIERTPLGEEVDQLFDPDDERFRHAEYAVDLALSKLNDLCEPHTFSSRTTSATYRFTCPYTIGRSCSWSVSVLSQWDRP